MIEKDMRVARFKVSGGLPLMRVRISDQKMKDVLCLINSIPLPQKSSELFPERQVSSVPVISHRTKGLLGTSLLLDGVESGSIDEINDDVMLTEASSTPQVTANEEIDVTLTDSEEETDSWRKLSIEKMDILILEHVKTHLESRSTLGHSRSPWSQDSSSHTGESQDPRNCSRISTMMQPLRQNAAEGVDLPVDEYATVASEVMEVVFPMEHLHLTPAALFLLPELQSLAISLLRPQGSHYDRQ
ncbi:hypothetical protein MC885_018506 [Smutsia gigantea]|nr:hypothetical protein MC885_018506 [Smutsia gigantea]